MEMLTGDLSRRDYAEEGAAWFERLLAVADEEISLVVRAQALA
jgi:hypothetical protein